MNHAEAVNSGAHPTIDNRDLERVVGGADLTENMRYCKRCKMPTPHTPTASGSYACNICGYDPGKATDD